MRRSLARYSAPVSSVHASSWADFITTMVGFRVFGTFRYEKAHVAPVLDAANEGLFDVATSGDLIKQGGVHCLRVGLAGELKQSAIRRVD